MRAINSRLPSSPVRIKQHRFVTGIDKKKGNPSGGLPGKDQNDPKRLEDQLGSQLNRAAWEVADAVVIKEWAGHIREGEIRW